MPGHCTNKNCFVDEGESCARGHLNPTECECWSKKKAGSSEDKEQSYTAARVPWSGSTLGMADLSSLLPRGRSMLIGVLGAHDAGKTTLLTGCYQNLLAGHPMANAQFAGSRTLGAWESLAAFTRFDDPAKGPTFPPHTPRGTNRVPGLMHVALRGTNEELRDVLMTDAPGEWFSSWAIDEKNDLSQGARWVVGNSDAFLIFADCERLSAPGRGRGHARSEIRQLIERVANHVNDRPTTLVWAKSDVTPPEKIKESVKKALYKNIPHATEIETTINDIETLKAALESVIFPCWLPSRMNQLVEPIVKAQPFEAYRGDRG
ncbi:hypothetical protein GO013_00030 [Pseudodesulfovibrio sp. JC047]|uniref:TRAFAC clade GTPase domain-containing protein n=1 Tax=Pseudodesulfovibrio sp. JC047 TaxID=2683199 RepID=UPI0013D583B0|nr:hypothetical protein [Pseudodesulfovibrio sp. JC047]NDV17805.1 hypothetical protein [Pseudodesulfovibrio sp. JC047]